MSACLQGEHEEEYDNDVPTRPSTLYAQGGDGAFRRVVPTPLMTTAIVHVCRHCRAVYVPRRA